LTADRVRRFIYAAQPSRGGGEHRLGPRASAAGSCIGGVGVHL